MLKNLSINITLSDDLLSMTNDEALGNIIRKPETIGVVAAAIQDGHCEGAFDVDLNGEKVQLSWNSTITEKLF